MVLMKSFDRGFVFFTHATSQKGTEMAANPHVALVFHWHTQHRSVRIRGVVSAIASHESDAYWATRARSAQLSALATLQSEPMPERSVLEARVSLLETQFPEGTAIPRPPHWHGFVVAPLSIEFWTSAGVSRLHDRQLFVRRTLDAHEWEHSLLQP
jgi:pyridoxamine 5'-phosphate oxidase